MTQGWCDISVCLSEDHHPQVSGQESWKLGVGAGKELLSWTGSSFYNVLKALDVIQGIKSPKMTLCWSHFVSVAIVVLKSLCGQGCREKAKESLSSEVTRCPFKVGAAEEWVLGVSYLWVSQSISWTHTSLSFTASHSQPHWRQVPQGIPAGTCTQSALKPKAHTPALGEAWTKELPHQTTSIHSPSTPHTHTEAGTATQDTPPVSCKPLQRS